MVGDRGNRRMGNLLGKEKLAGERRNRRMGILGNLIGKEKLAGGRGNRWIRKPARKGKVAWREGN